MIADLLLLAFKQDCQHAVDTEPLTQQDESQGPQPITQQDESHPNESLTQSHEPLPNSSEDTSSDLSGKAPIHDAYEFVALLGERLEKYWKIGIHWLTALRNVLLEPFTAQILETIVLMQ